MVHDVTGRNQVFGNGDRVQVTEFVLVHTSGQLDQIFCPSHYIRHRICGAVVESGTIQFLYSSVTIWTPYQYPAPTLVMRGVGRTFSRGGGSF